MPSAGGTVQFGLVVWVADVALAGHASPASQPSAVEVVPAVVALDPNGHWVAGDAAGTLPADRHVTRMPWWAEDARAEIAGVALTGAGYIAALVLVFADRVRRRLGAGAQLVDVTVLAPGGAWAGLSTALSFALPEVDVRVTATAEAAAGTAGPAQVVDWRGGAPEVTRVGGDSARTAMLPTADALSAALVADLETVLVGPQRLLPELAQWLRRSARVDMTVPIEDVITRAAQTVRFGTGDPEHVPVDDDVQFTVYRPRVVRPAVPEKLVAFAHKSDLYEEDGRVVDPIAEVAEQAEAVLGDLSRHAQTIADSNVAIMRGDTLRFVPVVDGIEFNPTALEFRWSRGVHREVFEFRADPSLDGRTASGRLSVFLGMVLIADVSLRIRVDSTAADPAAERARASVYGKVFPSYSHDDKVVVDQVVSAARTLGHTYLRDVDQLRSGQDWQREIEHYIDQADIFQLFWSPRSMYSPHVRHEWTYALSLGRPDFIRPVYWQFPRPSAPPDLPPPELDRLHFMYLAGDEPAAHPSPPSPAQPEAPRPRRQRRFAGAATGVAVAAAATIAVTLGVAGPTTTVGLGHGSVLPTQSATPTTASSTFNDSVGPPGTGQVPDLSRSQLVVMQFFTALNVGDTTTALGLVCAEHQVEFRNAVDNLAGATWGVPRLLRHHVVGENLLLRYAIVRRAASSARRFRIVITLVSENERPVICAISG